MGEDKVRVDRKAGRTREEGTCSLLSGGRNRGSAWLNYVRARYCGARLRQSLSGRSNPRSRRFSADNASNGTWMPCGRELEYGNRRFQWQNLSITIGALALIFASGC